jgi:hypothetical protein
VLGLAPVNGVSLLENNAPAGFGSASVDPKIDALNSGASMVQIGYEGLVAAGVARDSVPELRVR